MLCSGCDLKALANSQLTARFLSPSLNCQMAPQHEIVVRHLAVAMPWDDLPRSERENSGADERVGHDGLDLFHSAIRPLRSRLLHDKFHSSSWKQTNGGSWAVLAR